MSSSTQIFRAGLFRDKFAVVSGGGTGIGLAVCQQLLELGCNVMMTSRRPHVLASAADRLNSRLPPHTRCYHHPCDIRREEDVQRLMDECQRCHGSVDFLVNNGGGQFMSSAAECSAGGWRAVVDTNLTGTFLMCRLAHERFLRHRGGAIVNMLADMFRGFPMMSHTGAARAGVENLTRSLAVEWAEHGVRVNAVAPGVVYSATAAANYPSCDVFGAAASQIPAQRCGSTHEVAAAICFLLSPAASYINGATLRVDGGSSLYAKCFHQVPPHDNMPAYRGVTSASSDHQNPHNSVDES